MLCLQTSFYMCIGCMSYAAFGNKSPGNLLTGGSLKGFLSLCIVCSYAQIVASFDGQEILAVLVLNQGCLYTM